ncbi:hypothetical protein PIB30_058819 [Stylosanthes scabra]|uniref:F-box domain-containing protein n=1 Tax=Stylosanthes scabra TaxID=79078 RepID=A0ABU6RK18_9FABA|nr:hypothetical protein [Stylosanthes scabra]
MRSRFSLSVSSSTMHCVVGDEDLLTEILLRLPVKDLLRCKGVCKKWKSLTSEPQFRYRHTLGLCRKHKHNPFLYSSGIILSPCPCRPSLRTLEKVHIIPFSNNSDNRIIPLDVHNKFDEQLENSFLRSCNGLLLWKSSPKEFGVKQGSFYVSNLTTGDCVRIDRFGHHDASLSKLYLAFEPWKSPHYKVIFFDKVVGNNREDYELTTKIKVCVYSSETGSWSKHDVLVSFPNNDINNIIEYDGVYCNGAIHWYFLRENSVYFDIGGLCFKDLPTLPLTSSQAPYCELSCRRNLHRITYTSDEKGKFDIWELKEDYSGWIPRYHVDLTTFQLGLQACKFYAVLGVVYQPPNEDEEEESVLVILAVDFLKIVSYNLKNRRSRIIYQENKGCYASPRFHGLYFETLMSI